MIREFLKDVMASQGSRVRAVLARVARHLPSKVITHKTPLATKYKVAEVFGWCLYLHRFHRGDFDWELHNHPWTFGASLILAGGYTEERGLPTLEDKAPRGYDRCEVRYAAGDVNLGIDRGLFHRISWVTQPDVWTLFVHSPTIENGWGFMTEDGYMPLRDFEVYKARRDFLRASGNVECACGRLYRQHMRDTGVNQDLHVLCDGTRVKL